MISGLRISCLQSVALASEHHEPSSLRVMTLSQPPASELQLRPEKIKLGDGRVLEATVFKKLVRCGYTSTGNELEKAKLSFKTRRATELARATCMC